MDDIDPNHYNLDRLPDSVVSDLSFNTSGNIKDIIKRRRSKGVLLFMGTKLCY